MEKYQDHTEQVAPRLAEMEKRNIYQVPDGFFHQLKDNIRDNVADEVETSWVDKLIQGVSLTAMTMAVVAMLFLSIRAFTGENRSNWSEQVVPEAFQREGVHPSPDTHEETSN